MDWATGVARNDRPGRVMRKPVWVLALVVMGLAATATAESLRAVAGPLPHGSWAERFAEGYSTSPAIDRMEVRMLTEGVTFVDGGFVYFDAPGWTAVLPADGTSGTTAVATGPSIKVIEFNIAFSPPTPPSTRFQFTFDAYAGTTLVDHTLADWDGATWTLVPEDMRRPRVPLPSTASGVLATLLALGVAGRFRWQTTWSNATMCSARA